MTTPHHPRTTPAAAVEHPTTATKHWAYPFALRDASAPNDLHHHFQAISAMPVGMFPIACSGFLNGSVFFGEECTGLTIDEGFRCLADGEVVAYRLDRTLHTLTYDPAHVVLYSLGFVLVRHRMDLPPGPPREPAPQGNPPIHPRVNPPVEEAMSGIDIYSLYSYNRPLDRYEEDADGFLKVVLPFWKGSHKYRVGSRARDSQLLPPVVERYPRIYGAPPPAPDPDAPVRERAIGLRVRQESNSRGAVIGLLPRGCILTVRGEATSGWAQIAEIERGSALPYTLDERVDERAVANGWVYLGELERTVTPSPVDEVVVLDPPCPVKAGDLLGFLGENPGKHQAEPQGGVPRLKARVAIEVFAGAEFPDYLAEARRRVAALPEAEKPMLIVEKGAKLCRSPRAAEMTLTPGYVLVPPAGVSTTGSFVYGSIHRIERVPVHSAVPRDAMIRGYTKADGTDCIGSAHYDRLSQAKKALYTQREILIPDGDTAPRWALRDRPANANMAIWDAPPLSKDDATLTVGFQLSCNRGQLNSLDASRRFIDIDGSHWWQIEVGDEENSCLLGWVCSKDHPGTRWESPHAWPGFHITDATMFEPMAALQRNVCLMGDVLDEHREEFEPVMTALGASNFITNLEQIIGLVGTRKGSVVSSDIGEAQQRPWIAHRVSRQIVRFESQWSSGIDRWTQLNPYMNADWHVDMERQEKSGWWNEVAGKLAGFPSDATVHHIHPFGWVDNFSKPISRYPQITINGEKVVLPFLEMCVGSELSNQDFIDAAEFLACEPEVIQAIAKVETGETGSFFLPGRSLAADDDIVPTILYERHIFHKLTGGSYDRIDPEISDAARYVKQLADGEHESPKRMRYGPSSGQYARLMRAYALAPDAALMSASWGRFQLMGFNHLACGHDAVTAFVGALSRSESSHLRAAVSFMKQNPLLLDAIRRKDWVAIARQYNGRYYDDYDVRMSRAYDAIKAKK